MSVPNLDCMTMNPDELFTWGCRHSGTVRPVAAARELFPDRPAGYITVTKQLGHYAVNKATAMRARLDGNVQTALIYESICERIYSRLPEWGRW